MPTPTGLGTSSPMTAAPDWSLILIEHDFTGELVLLGSHLLRHL